MRVIWPVLCATGVPGGRPAGIAVVEALALQDLDHLLAGRRRDRPFLRDRGEQRQQAAGRGGVVQPRLERLAILDAPSHLHAVGAQVVHRGPDRVHAQPLDEDVCREVAADGDHRLAQAPVAHGLPDGLVDLGIRVVLRRELVGAAVDDAREAIGDRDRGVEREPAEVRLAEQLDHHRHLHRARGVEHLVWLDERLVAAVDGPEGDGDLGPAAGDEGVELGSQRADGRRRRLLGRCGGCLRGGPSCGEAERDGDQERCVRRMLVSGTWVAIAHVSP